MTVKDYKDGKIITLSKPFDNRSKILNIIYFGTFVFAGFYFIYMPLSEAGFSHFGVYVFIAIASGIFLFAAYRFINKALQTEIMIVNKNTLTIIKRGLISTRNENYDTSQISNFRHLDKPEIVTYICITKYKHNDFL